jgi:EAL domain-containing protein (putative c-di-GMP-specific phosphodiesterase class I)
MAAWVKRGLPGVCISVNVSALQFTRGSFVNTVEEALATSGLPAGCLELELTESLIMRDVDHSAGIMQALSDLGVKIAIDDFGTGYSSLSYLRRLPAHTLKIDRSFIQAVDTPKGAALLETIVTLGHALGLTVTAEGVETIYQMELLRRARCNRMQGHLIGLATTADSLEQMLFSEWRWAAVPVA